VAIGRTYVVDVGGSVSTGIAVGTGGVAGTEYVLMYGGTAGEFNISSIRVSTWSGASASYPNNGTITWRLRRVSSTNTGILVGTATAAPISQSVTAAASVWIYSTGNGSGTATFATPGNVIWEQTTPATAGANWGEWFTPGFELNVTNSTLALTYQLGAAGSISAVNLVPELVISE
jgi:hypothetical protein